MVEENVSHYFRTYVKWITGIGVGVAILALIWLTLQLLLGEQRAATLELSLHHVIGPSLASSPPPASEDIPNVSIAIDMEEAKKNQEDLRGNLLQNGKAYPIKFIISQLHPAANSFFSKLAIKVRKGQLYNDMEEFEILPPISSSQISEWIKREIARSIGFDEIGKFFPINLEVNRKHNGLRFVSALPQTLSMDLSNIPYLKLFCRVSSEVLDVEKKLTGAAKSKIPVRPDEEWSITAPMLGEGVTGPEFARMKALASKSVLSFEEEPELLRLVDMRYFGKYAAIVTLIDEADLEDMPTPSSFRFEEISGRIRPSFQLCNAEGLMPRSDQWFHSLMDKLKEQSEFTASYNNTVELLASSAVNEHLIAPLKLLVNEQLLSSINATPFRYAATPSGKLGYVYGSNASAEVKRSFARLTSGGPLLERAPSGVRASLDPQTNDLSSSKSIVIDGNKALLEDLVVREGQTLSVKAGASIQIAPGVSILVAGGTAKFEGSQEAPIRISGLSSAPWGSVVISDGGNAAVNYAVITGGSETYRDYVRYDGAFAVHNASVSISDSQIDGIVSFNKSVIDLENVTFINVIPKIFLSKGAQVLARNVKHIQNTPQHTLAILQQTPHGVPHTEREFKYTIHADWRSQQLLEAAEALQSYLGRVLSDRSKWKAPEFSTDRALYRPDTKVGEFAYADIYIDTDDHLNYKHDISYRYRYRFENRKAFNSYVRNPEKPRFWPFRLEYQGKIGRGHPAPGFSEVYEARFEFRKQSLPFSEDYLAPWSPWDIETFLPFMLAGSYKGISTVSGAEVERFLSEKTQRSDFAFGPRVVVVTERLRQHLNIPTEWGSGPN
ncbi:MAG: hypothetical protein KDD70_16150, partial [Bdellovibrionales bacterium]|nr:hypothetical protein [Bdellovibrionales bacterium]